ncbi:unnamed protein product [Dovyalis caffra]|uniref:Uncharacterized protein n=1 Tax=Dovyalis caffra TaxID=77055 RepID=A0AAV1QPZ6_9ROSI|nr:unnamed protein product [Dovyalis caffra]
MDASIQITLPPVSALSSSALSFLNSEQDLSQARSFFNELQSQCFELEQTLIDLNSRLHSTFLSYASSSDGILLLFHDASSKLTDLYGQRRKEEILGEDLPALAKEVARVEMVRAYAGLYVFVAQFEDGLFSVVNL